jgi:hypothetical protein
MKKLLVGIMMLLMFTGCAGLNTTTAVNVATDTAFVLILQNNPTYKAPVIEALKTIKVFLSGSVTYDDLMIEIARVLPDKYIVIAVVLSGYIQGDKPIFETYLPMLDGYKADIIKEVDRLILLAGI